VILYYITDRMQVPGRERERRQSLLSRIGEAARLGIDFIQLREKDLSTRDLEILAREAVSRVRAAASPTRLLINSRTDVALAAGADGVHLRSKDISPADVRKIWSHSGVTNSPVVGVSCHTLHEVAAAESAGADFAVLSPIFEKKHDPNARIAGLDLLRAVCQRNMPVIALGGITPENAPRCVNAGARGIAGIRIFQESNFAVSIKRFRTDTASAG
jgi:thiamine-phosphate pyrophosphorylase